MGNCSHIPPYTANHMNSVSDGTVIKNEHFKLILFSEKCHTSDDGFGKFTRFPYSL